MKIWKTLKSIETKKPGTPLEVQWLRLTAFTAEGPGSIPGWGTKIPKLCSTARKKKKKEKPAAGVPGHIALALLRGTVLALEEAAPMWAGPPDHTQPRQQPGGLRRKGSQRRKTLPLGSKISPGSLGFETYSFPSGSDSEESTYNAREPRFGSWLGKISWRREWQLTPLFPPGESHGQRSLVGYSPWGCKESDTTEHFHSFSS